MENFFNLFFFKLKSNSLTCYRNEDHDDEKFTLALNGFKVRFMIRDAKIGFIIELVNPNRRKLKRLRLECLSDKDFVQWKESFERVLNRDDLVRFDIFFNYEIDFNYLCQFKKKIKPG